MQNLNEGKKKKGGMAYEAALREIDAQSAVVALEAKIEKLKEMAETKAQRLEMVSEDENLSELIDKKAMNEMRKEIKQIEKMQEKLEKLYEKKNGKKPVEVVDEEEKMDETYSASSYEEDDSVSEGGYDSSYEEDDNNPSMEEELNEAESPGKIINKMVQNADKLEKSPEMEKMAAQIAKNPELIKILNQKVAAAGITIDEQEVDGIEDTELEKLALTYAKKLNEGDATAELGLGAALGLGGAITGFNLGSTVAYLAGTSIAIGSTVAIGPVLLGAAAGIALGVLAAKVAKKIKGTNEEVDRFKKLAGL
tara:strand:+ start:129 stop:1055 length:927 start_codon:yes stop_codon:yes gene_type:complete